MGYGIRRIIIFTIGLTSTVAGFAGGHRSDNFGLTPADFSSRQTRVPREYLITLVPGADIKVITDLYGYFGIKSIKDMGRNIFLVTLTEDPGLVKMEELRGQNPNIMAVQPNYTYQSDKTRNAQ